MIWQWLRFIAVAIFMLGGIFIFIAEIIGIFRFKFVLNRMHAAAMGDTLGLFLIVLGSILISGFSFASLKLFMVVVFYWICSPIAGHMICLNELTTNPKVEDECEVHKL